MKTKKELIEKRDKIQKEIDNFKEKTIYDLRLHETLRIETLKISTRPILFDITRVPSGWIYEHYRIDSNELTAEMTAVFVPFELNQTI